MTSRLMRLLALVVAVATLGLVGGVGAGLAGAAPPEVVGKKTVQVRGTADDGSKFNGQFTVTNFREATTPNSPSPFEAVGDLTGKLIHPGQGAAAQTVSQSGVAMPAAVGQASCQILDLVLGPLTLDLLGLQVHLDTVHLNITAVPGAGNLLGNLLCAVAGLLDPSGAITNLTQFLTLLNQLLGLLG
jgi:type IV secretory pathway VirB2 component (pilin)